MVADTVARLTGGAILAAGGWRLGEYISDTWGPELYVPWVFGLAASGMVIGLAATPYVTVRLGHSLVEQAESIPTSRLLSSIVGMILGMLVALLISIPLFSRISGWTGVVLPVGLSIFLGYLGTILMSSPARDLFPDESMGLGQNGYASNGTIKHLVDTSAIIDGRIADISQTGFLIRVLVIPDFILDELRHIADSSDPLRRARGRRGLEILNKLRNDSSVPTQIMTGLLRNGQEVDAKLVELAKELHASIVTTDYNLNRVAQIQGIAVLNVNELANTLRPVVLPGEKMTIKVVQEGKEPGQGVGFMDDGTMIVVESGKNYLNRDMDVSVTRVLQTAAGCIIFAQPKWG